MISDRSADQNGRYGPVERKQRKVPPVKKTFDPDQTIRAVLDILKLTDAAAGSGDAAAPLSSLIRHMAADGHRRDDPIREIFARLGDKWSMLLLLLLRAGTFRHAVLQRLASEIGADQGISQRMLTLRLRSLERNGLVERTVTPTVPPRVDYSLTTLGHGLVTQAETLIGWVRTHADEIRAARGRFHACGAPDDD